MKFSPLLPIAFASACFFLSGTTASQAVTYVDFGGPATGYLAMSNVKNSTSQNGIENKNGETNGLPDFANYRMANGNYTAIVTSPQSTTSDYSAFGQFSSGTYQGNPIVINNQLINDASFSTMSAGRIEYDNALITGNGIETIPLSALTFNFNTYLWDGKTQNGYQTAGGPYYISPFSPVYTVYNDGGGAGNAPLFYTLAASGMTGTGLTFENGVLTNMDFTGTISVTARAAQLPAFSGVFTGTFTGSGLNYEFDVADTQSVLYIQNGNMIMNRAGTASLVPEPSSALMAGLAGLALLRRRRVC